MWNLFNISHSDIYISHLLFLNISSSETFSHFESKTLRDNIDLLSPMKIQMSPIGMITKILVNVLSF